MTRAFNHRHVLNNHRHVLKTVASMLVVLALMLTFAATPSAHASARAAAVTTTPITYRLSGQRSSTALAGWMSGTQDSTGVLTATLTTANATTNAPVTATVSGRIMGRGASTLVLLTATPLPGSGRGPWVMAGGATGTAGEWAGTFTQGSASVGSWTLTPQTTSVSINFGGKSATTSKDKVSVSGLISAGVTAGGWADGTYTSFDGRVTTVVHGWVNRGGDIEFTIPWGHAGMVVLVGLQGKQRLTHPSWSGTFIGPGVGDIGTWIAQT